MNGRNGLTWDEKFNLDVDYIDKISFINDLKIIIKTITTVLTRKGISKDGVATMDFFTGTVSEIEKDMEEINV